MYVDNRFDVREAVDERCGQLDSVVEAKAESFLSRVENWHRLARARVCTERGVFGACYQPVQL